MNQKLTIPEAACIDIDSDGVVCDDNCTSVANPDQADVDDDGIGDVCQCVCQCHADPGACNGSQDIVDLVQVVNVALRGNAPIPDPNPNCDYETTDTNCSFSADVIDVVKMVNVAFRGADPATEFCQPCP